MSGTMIPSQNRRSAAPGGSAQDEDLQQVEEASRRMRRLAMEMIHHAGSGHVGSSLSCVDIVAVLRFDQMRWSASPRERDVFVLSKGHAAPAWYSALIAGGDLDPDLVTELRQLDSPLQGHPDRTRCAFVDVSTGALGQGLSIALGRAQARRGDAADSHVYCLIGDGECQEGQVWEALLYAGARRVDNLTLIVDANGRQSDGLVDDTVSLGPLANKLAAFGWRVVEVDGHSHRELRAALSAARRNRGRPSAVIAHTTKGYLAPGRAALDGAHSGLLDADALDEAYELIGAAR
ncbi:transketolase [Catenulispora yoronensis]|uniref:Transketolase n=1 Tax=Catenulispora yoronensis TaxID=450799 RepID=A0ABN2UC74_9ACTN